MSKRRKTKKSAANTMSYTKPLGSKSDPKKAFGGKKK